MGLPRPSSTTTYEFHCQHGERECKGNKIQACTVDMYLDDLATQVSLITCMMSASHPEEAGPSCFSQYSQDYSAVQACLDSGRGDLLHAAAGEATANTDPKVNNVPWLNFDGEHPAEYWDLEDIGLLSYICQHYTVAGCP